MNPVGENLESPFDAILYGIRDLDEKVHHNIDACKWITGFLCICYSYSYNVRAAMRMPAFSAEVYPVKVSVTCYAADISD